MLLYSIVKCKEVVEEPFYLSYCQSLWNNFRSEAGYLYRLVVYFTERFFRENCKTCNNKNSNLKENQEVELQPLSAGNQTIA